MEKRQLGSVILAFVDSVFSECVILNHATFLFAVFQKKLPFEHNLGCYNGNHSDKLRVLTLLQVAIRRDNDSDLLKLIVKFFEADQIALPKLITRTDDFVQYPSRHVLLHSHVCSRCPSSNPPSMRSTM